MECWGLFIAKLNLYCIHNLQGYCLRPRAEQICIPAFCKRLKRQDKPLNFHHCQCEISVKQAFGPHQLHLARSFVRLTHLHAFPEIHHARYWTVAPYFFFFLLWMVSPSIIICGTFAKIVRRSCKVPFFSRSFTQSQTLLSCKLKWAVFNGSIVLASSVDMWWKKLSSTLMCCVCVLVCFLLASMFNFIKRNVFWYRINM